MGIRDFIARLLELVMVYRKERLFAVVDDIFCLFQGHIENVALLKQQYGLNKTANEVVIVIEAYRTLRDRGPYPADQVVRDIHGKFAFILYESTSKATFIAADADGSVPFFWGNDSEGHLVLSDDAEIVKKGCGKSFAPFPKGCFFTSFGGLRSFEHLLNEVKPVPRVDSSGQVWCNFHFGCRDLRGNLLACQQELEVLPTGPQTTDLVNVFLCSTAVVISGWALLLISLFLIILP
uniref:DUF3700 domain-containing protein n=1 Tax=Fagus sylvatica TaxID=28930 RepID=A0A2N9I7I9_FAGSY